MPVPVLAGISSERSQRSAPGHAKGASCVKQGGQSIGKDRDRDDDKEIRPRGLAPEQTGGQPAAGSGEKDRKRIEQEIEAHRLAPWMKAPAIAMPAAPGR